MSSLSYLFRFGYIFLILIPWTNAVSLDANCTKTEECDQPAGLICRDEKCKCDAPRYQPCNTSCEIQKNFVYQGAMCRVNGNCMENAQCNDTSKQCICKENFSAINGFCYKKHNETCGNDNECWSRQCHHLSNRCTCRIGYEPLNDGRCKRKLAKIYNNYTKANESNDFCFDDSSCLNINAVCKNDSIHPERFCQCPSPGYTTDLNAQKCEIVLTDQLSPSNEISSTKNPTCGYCKDDNAVCVPVDNKRTCWCRAGYDKIGEKCELKRTAMIFPSATDLSFHSFGGDCNATDGSTISQGNLCTCADYHEFDSTTRSCKKIERRWINENFAYGICTRIQSNDMVQTSNNALCPPPLKCLANGDKYVCSCGTDRIIEERSDENRCVYRLEKNAVDRNISCPMNANRMDNNTCRCDDGFKQVDIDRRCELILQPKKDLGDCNETQSVENNQPCVNLYGTAAVLCQLGQCRCNATLSFAYENKSCYALLNVNQTQPMPCPLNSKAENSTLCECADGYRNSTDREHCEPKSKLFEWNGTTFPHQGDDLQQKDCYALFSNNSVILVEISTNKSCQCVPSTFVSPDGQYCWPFVYTNLTDSITNCLTPNSQRDDGIKQCVCMAGFRPTGLLRKDCEPIRGKLYESIDIIPNSSPISDSDCQVVFGQLSQVNDSGCICRDDDSFANIDKSRCLAVLNVNTTISTLENNACPHNASIQSETPGICQCNQGFMEDKTSHTCITADILLNGTKIRPISATCPNFTDENCWAKFGDGSFCENNQCWCDRQIAFKTSNNRCERLSKYIFPGLHERNNFSCHVDQDCANNGIDINTIICEYIHPGDEYTVCTCKQGWVLNLETQKCEMRCPSNCMGRLNSECNGYDCVCKNGFVEVNKECVPNPNILKLYQACNSSYIVEKNESFRCTSCNRGGCATSYKDADFKCVKYNFDTDYCVPTSMDFCMDLISHSQCNEDDNKCICSNGYYREENTCVRPVDSRCKTNEECGANKQCVDRQCKCIAGKERVEIHDAYDRLVFGCVNGVDQIRFNPIWILFFIFTCLFFA